MPLDATLLGLPADAWLLLIVAVGLGLGLELAFMRARRRDATVEPGAGNPRP